MYHLQVVKFRQVMKTFIRILSLIILISSSYSETEDSAHDIRAQMSKFNIENHRVHTDSSSWRAKLAKVDVWYASYGSNMWEPRFLCYIQGGQVEGMKKVCVGSMDKSPPKDIMWNIFPNRFFFGRESSSSWGAGGVAFTNPLTNNSEQTHMCLYRITLEQFNDVMFQENGKKVDSEVPLFDLAALESVKKKGSLAALNGWYGNIVYLGKESNIPILTMTCTLSDFEKYKSGDIPVRAPAKAYAATLIRGLVEGKRLSEKEAKAYIDNAASKPL